MSSFVIFDFRFSSKPFATRPTYKGLVVEVNDFVDIQIVLGHERFPTIRTSIVPNAGMNLLVLDEIVLTVESFAAFLATIQALTILVDFHVSREGVLRSEVLEIEILDICILLPY